MDFTKAISDALTSYKHHTEIVKTFINANGGKTTSPRDWDFAPHLVAQHLGDKGIPANITLSLAKAIEKRKLVAKHYESIRQAVGGKLTESDLRHLNFIDRLETIERIWLPVKSSQTTPADFSARDHGKSTRVTIRSLQSLSASTGFFARPDHFEDGSLSGPCHYEWSFREPANAEKPLSSGDIPFDGAFTIELIVAHEKVYVWHPHHTGAAVWYGTRSLDHAKSEVWRLLGLHLPVRVVVRDRRGCYSLTGNETCAFAWVDSHQAYDQYERTGRGKPLTPWVHGGSAYDAFEKMVHTHGHYDEIKHDPPLGDQDDVMVHGESFNTERVWRFLNSEPPLRRSFDVYQLDTYRAELNITSSRSEIREIVSEGVDLRTILRVLKHRNDDVRLYGRGGGTYTELKDCEDVSKLFGENLRLVF